MAVKEPYFGRLIPAMVTPFDEDLNLDLDRAQELADRLIQGGCDSIVVCGTTGESPTVFYPQKLELFRAVKDAIGGRVKLIANVGDNCTADTIDFAHDVEKIGVDGLMCVVPYYNKPPQKGIYAHFASIARAVDTPIILYNIPGRCVVNMEADTTIQLVSDYDKFVAIKEASGNYEQIQKIIRMRPPYFNVYSGDDSATYDIMKMGGVGVVSTIANVAPERMREIIDLCVAGDWDQAKIANDKLMPLMEGLFAAPNPILVKEALRLSGFDVGGVRLPLVDASLFESASLKVIMEEVGVLKPE